MSTTPLVSICIPAYNASDFIVSTIQNWQQQTYNHIEIIIQDDCSTDDTYEKALDLAKKDKRIKVFKNAKNYGIGKNWNECYSHVKGEYTVIFNADDRINLKFLEIALQIFKKEQIDLVTFQFSHLEGEINYIHQPQIYLLDGIINNPLEMIFFEMPFHWDFTLIKTSVLNQLSFNTQKLFKETQICDAELWYRVALNNLRIWYCNFNAGYYVKHPNNNSKIAFSEDKSFILDVLPSYNSIFKKEFNKRYSDFLLIRITHLVKKTLLSFNIIGIKLALKLFKLYLKK